MKRNIFIYFVLKQILRSFLARTIRQKKKKCKEAKSFCQNPQFLFWGVKEIWHKGLCLFPWGIRCRDIQNNGGNFLFEKPQRPLAIRFFIDVSTILIKIYQNIAFIFAFFSLLE